MRYQVTDAESNVYLESDDLNNSTDVKKFLERVIACLPAGDYQLHVIEKDENSSLLASFHKNKQRLLKVLLYIDSPNLHYYYLQPTFLLCSDILEIYVADKCVRTFGAARHNTSSETKDVEPDSTDIVPETLPPVSWETKYFPTQSSSAGSIIQADFYYMPREMLDLMQGTSSEHSSSSSGTAQYRVFVTGERHLRNYLMNDLPRLHPGSSVGGERVKKLSQAGKLVTLHIDIFSEGLRSMREYFLKQTNCGIILCGDTTDPSSLSKIKHLLLDWKPQDMSIRPPILVVFSKGPEEERCIPSSDIHDLLREHNLPGLIIQCDHIGTDDLVYHAMAAAMQMNPRSRATAVVSTAAPAILEQLVVSQKVSKELPPLATKSPSSTIVKSSEIPKIKHEVSSLVLSRPTSSQEQQPCSSSDSIFLQELRRENRKNNSSSSSYDRCYPFFSELPKKIADPHYEDIYIPESVMKLRTSWKNQPSSSTPQALNYTQAPMNFLVIDLLKASILASQISNSLCTVTQGETFVAENILIKGSEKSTPDTMFPANYKTTISLQLENFMQALQQRPVHGIVICTNISPNISSGHLKQYINEWKTNLATVSCISSSIKASLTAQRLEIPQIIVFEYVDATFWEGSKYSMLDMSRKNSVVSITAAQGDFSSSPKLIKAIDTIQATAIVHQLQKELEYHASRKPIFGTTVDEKPKKECRIC
jgi:hypothetical protein